MIPLRAPIDGNSALALPRALPRALALLRALPRALPRALALLRALPRALPRALTSLALASLLGACGPKSGVTRHDLTSTQGKVRFSKEREAFYERQWVQRVKATTPRICAGFVHSETFERYLKYGKFELQMTLEVFKGGSPKVENGQVTGWQGGKLLRTIRKRRPVSASNNAYVWCGRLQKGGRWKEGAMRYTFELKGPEPAMDELLAQGILRIEP